MSTSNVPSPLSAHPFSPENSTFDFLQFMGLDTSTSPYASSAPTAPPADPGSVKSITDEQESRGGSSRGRTKGQGSRHTRGARSSSSGAHTATGGNNMELDTGIGGSNGIQPFGPSQMLGMAKDQPGQFTFGLGGSIGQVNGQDFDAAQAQSLQQQLEHIHMQSPLVFDSNNLQQSPFLPMAQMFLTSPANGLSQLPNSILGSEGTSMDEKEIGRRLSMMNNYGMITPGPSAEMNPQARIDQMSPMQLEMLSRGEHGIDMTPLLSPALSNQQQSVQASPAAHLAFKQIQQGGLNSNKSPLEILQEQQRQFQEQLSLLQQQQRELQATAAAVAAASANANVAATASASPSVANSPYIAAQQNRGATTPGVNVLPSGGSLGTPSPGYFSPLTSPAMESRGNFGSQHGYSRGPHPLSALSSPALNPVGSSGGAQQTLSPALEPQSGQDMSDPDYIRALSNMLDNSSYQQDQSHSYQSPSLMPQHQSSPLVGPITKGAGPHRHSLPAKTRPSPMMKPINHRSHGKHGSSSSGYPIPTSPAIQRVVQSGMGMPGMGYLPPSAFQPQYSNGSGTGTSTGPSAFSNSAPSTPSPVDLNQLMPPPPVPPGNKSKGVAPVTPASLMNLGGGNAEIPSMLDDGTDSGRSTPLVVPKRQGSRNSIGSTGAAKVQSKRVTAATPLRKGAAASRLAPSAAGKRALAMRPAGDVGVRAGAAAAASLPLPEGENRKTSHKAAEQKRRDSLKAGFDELRLLLPPINTEALDPESGEPIPGSSAPRLLPKSSLVPDDNPNRGVSKVALLKFSNEYIVRLHEKVEKRDDYIERLRLEVQRLREGGGGEEVTGEEGEDLLSMDMLDGEEDDFADPSEDEGEGGEGGGEGDDDDEGMNIDEDDGEWTGSSGLGRRKSGRKEGNRRPSIGKRGSSGAVKAGR